MPLDCARLDVEDPASKRVSPYARLLENDRTDWDRRGRDVSPSFGSGTWTRRSERPCPRCWSNTSLPRERGLPCTAAASCCTRADSGGCLDDRDRPLAGRRSDVWLPWREPRRLDTEPPNEPAVGRRRKKEPSQRVCGDRTTAHTQHGARVSQKSRHTAHALPRHPGAHAP